MKKVIFKSMILIGLISFLSMSSIAQIATEFYFRTIPNRPADRPQTVTIKCTYYMSTGETRISELSNISVSAGNSKLVYFPGSQQDAQLVTSTYVELSFYNKYTGTFGTFSKLPFYIVSPDNFGGWWTIAEYKEKDTH